jgi:ATP-dependent Clp protease adaptor protein ClpS
VNLIGGGCVDPAKPIVQTCYFFLLLKGIELGMNTSVEEQQLIDVLEVIETIEVRDLVVFNDDVNTFQHVIDTLIRVCKHTPEQAEQCTWLIHHKGKCTVKTAAFDILKPLKDAICEVGIDAKIL